MSNLPGGVHRALDRHRVVDLGRNLFAGLARRSECRVTAVLSREKLMPPSSPNKGGNMKTMAFCAAVCWRLLQGYPSRAALACLPSPTRPLLHSSMKRREVLLKI